MEFSYGVKAKVTFLKEPNNSYYYEDGKAVYFKLEPHLGHESAAEAEGWTEVAYIGEEYEIGGILIEMVEV